MLCGSVDGVFSGLIGGVFVSEEGVLECCGRLQILAEFVVGSCCANFGNAAPTAIQVKNWDRNYRPEAEARPTDANDHRSGREAVIASNSNVGRLGRFFGFKT